MTNLSTRLLHVNDDFLKSLKERWFTQSHPMLTGKEFIPIAESWFKSTKLNNLQGWDDFSCVDVVLGCTHFIESLLIKYSNNIQIIDTL